MASLGIVGEEFECEITNVAHGGVFVARHEGRVIFVSDAIDGERVRVRVVDDTKKSFWRAEVVEVIFPSVHRRAHVWPEADVSREPERRVGGAEFGHIDLAHQRYLKQRVLVDSFGRIGRMDLGAVVGHRVPVEPIGTDAERNGLHWRTRVRLHVDSEGVVGPFAARSRRVIPVESLPLATESIGRIAPLSARLPGVESLSFVAPEGGEAMQVDAGNPRVLTERVGPRSFRLRSDGFWQVHRDAAQTLTDAVTWALDDALVDPQAANLDLYGGVGLLAAALGDVAGTTTRMTTVESDAVATDFAGENLAEWVGARAVTARVDRYLRDLVSTAGATERARLQRATVVLDPPRSGAGREVSGLLGDIQPQQIVYVACDPVALARDAADLVSRGYRLEDMRAFDLFPHTHHVEAVARFVRE